MNSAGETKKPQRGAKRAERRQREEAALRRQQRQRRQRWIWWGGGSAVIVVLLGVVAFVGRGQAAPAIDGIQCNTSEGAVTHIHQHLVIYDRGQLVPVASDVGDNAIGSSTPCLFWLHTHSPDGVIHVEAPNQQTYTLGQFFDIWSQPLSRTTVAAARADASHPLRAYVNGRLYRGDPPTIRLTDRERITMEVGPPWLPTPPFPTGS